MKLEKLLLVEKETDIEYNSDVDFNKLEDEDKEDVIKKHKNHENFMRTLEYLLKDLGINYTHIKSNKLDSIDAKEYSLHMTVGGDGTFLDVARLFLDIPLIGINSTYTEEDNDGSFGGLTTLDKRNIHQLKKLKENGKIVHWRLVEAHVNGRRVDDYAVNEVYVGHPKGYLTSNIRVKTKDQKEKFGGSGVIVCTPMGSHAWFKSAGGTPFDNEIPAFGIIVREPSSKRITYRFTSKILLEDEFVIVSPVRKPCVLVYDSRSKEHELDIGDYVTAKLSDRYVKVVRF